MTLLKSVKSVVKNLLLISPFGVKISEKTRYLGSFCQNVCHLELVEAKQRLHEQVWHTAQGSGIPLSSRPSAKSRRDKPAPPTLRKATQKTHRLENQPVRNSKLLERFDWISDCAYAARTTSRSHQVLRHLAPGPHCRCRLLPMRKSQMESLRRSERTQPRRLN